MSQSISSSSETTGLPVANSRDIHNGQPNMATNLPSAKHPPIHGSTKDDGIVEVYPTYAGVNPKSGVLEPRTVQHPELVPTQAFPSGIEATQWTDWRPDWSAKPTNPMDVQIGGTHYKNYPIQPAEYAHVNKLGFIEACVVKYVTRWRDKGGTADLQKARHCIDLIIELERKYGKEV